MTFRKRYRWMRRLALALAFATTASPAAAMHGPVEPVGPVTTAHAQRGSGSNDVGYAFIAVVALTGIGGGSALAIRSRRGPRLARA